MILGVGVDLVSVERFAPWLASPAMIARFFSAEEAAGLPEPRAGNLALEYLASRFAAKEAFAKALGTGMRGLVLRDIEVAKRQGGQPFLRLRGPNLVLFEKAGGKALHLSISHDGGTAVALVVIEG
jgi:holo-[acyl-carrier protein] synthase